MNTNSVKVVAVLACDDVRREEDGKLIVIGVTMPSLSVAPSPGSKSIDEMEPLRLRFLLILDVLEKGPAEIRFQLKRKGARRGHRRRLSTVFLNTGKSVPLPIGPFLLMPQPGDTGFILQQRIGDRWRDIAAWEIDPPVPDLSPDEGE